MRIPILNGLGHALRWLRERQDKKQYQVAEAAGITKGMLSAYETGRQRPSLETLEKILGTLGCDLNDLHNAIQIINGHPEGMRRRGEGLPEAEGGEAPAGVSEEGGAHPELRRILGRNLPPDEEKALAEMLDGFHKFLRYLHGTLTKALRRRDEPVEGSSP